MTQRRAVDTALQAVVAALLISQIALIVWIIWNFSTNMPVNDTWQMVDIARRWDAGQLSWDDLWRPHAEAHRLVIPRLQTLVLIELTSWHNQFMLMVNLGLVLLTGGLLLAAARASLPSQRAFLIVAAPAILVLLTIGRYHNWLKPFTDKIPTALGAAICVWALASGPLTRWRVVVAIAGGLIASLSSFGGLAAWIAFLPVLFFIDRRWATVWLIAAVAFIAAYMMNLGSGNLDSQVVFAVPETPVFVLSYIGAPLAGRSGSLAVVAGAVSVTLCLLNCVVIWHLSRWQPRMRLAWPGLALFTLGAAGITALGRSDNIASSLASRYQGISPLWWIAVLVIGALAILISRTAPSFRYGRAVMVVNLVALAIGVVAAIVSSAEGLGRAPTWMERERLCEAEIRDWETAPQRCLRAYGNNEAWDAASYMPYLEQRGWAVFRSDLAP